MKVDRTQLQRQLKFLGNFGGAFPYVGIKLHEEKVYLHRSGEVGYIQTDGYARITVTPIVVSLAHLATSLSVIQGTYVDLYPDQSGTLCLSSTDTEFSADIKVFTLRPNLPWNKVFPVGDTLTSLPPDGLSGVTLGSAGLTCPPVLSDGTLLFSTHFGIVRKKVTVGNQVSSPREEMLRVLGGSDQPNYLTITKNGYWKALLGGFEVVVAGHSTGVNLAKQYAVNYPTIVEFPAQHLLYALNAAMDMGTEDSSLELIPEHGVSISTSMGTSKFALTGSVQGWPGGSIPKKVAKLIVSFLSQDAAGTVSMSQVQPRILRLSRGGIDITFGVS